MASVHCSSCFRETKYKCILCSLPICNLCSEPEQNDDTEGWIAGKSVGYCSDCKKDLALKRTVEATLGLSKPQSARLGRGSTQTCSASKSRLEETLDDNDFVFGNSVCDFQNTDPVRCCESPVEENATGEWYGKESEGCVNGLQKKKKKPGRKASWSDVFLNDLVDIITNNDYYKRKLIFTNVKNQKNGEIYMKVLEDLKKRAAERGQIVPFTANQLRTKFKKAVAECKKVALTIKSATGIKRVQDEKEYGSWFPQLFALVKTRDSCQPEQSIEPSSNLKSSSEPSTASESDERPQLFVPQMKRSGKGKKEDQIKEVISALREMNENDPMKDFISFVREEAEKSRQHELRLTELLLTNHSQAQAPYFGQSPMLNITGQNLTKPQQPHFYHFQ